MSKEAREGSEAVSCGSAFKTSSSDLAFDLLSTRERVVSASVDMATERETSNPFLFFVYSTIKLFIVSKTKSG